jgi:four helix bundle protein
MAEIIKSFKDLRVWKQAYVLVLSVYEATKEFPKDELYGMTSQMRRSSISVVSNIAEGYARRGSVEYARFLTIAYSSLAELETQILLSKDLKFVNEEYFNRLMRLKDETGGMLYKLIQKLAV